MLSLPMPPRRVASPGRFPARKRAPCGVSTLGGGLLFSWCPFRRCADCSARCHVEGVRRFPSRAARSGRLHFSPGERASRPVRRRLDGGDGATRQYAANAAALGPGGGSLGRPTSAGRSRRPPASAARASAASCPDGRPRRAPNVGAAAAAARLPGDACESASRRCSGAPSPPMRARRNGRGRRPCSPSSCGRRPGRAESAPLASAMRTARFGSENGRSADERRCCRHICASKRYVYSRAHMCAQCSQRASAARGCARTRHARRSVRRPFSRRAQRARPDRIARSSLTCPTIIAYTYAPAQRYVYSPRTYAPARDTCASLRQPSPRGYRAHICAGPPIRVQPRRRQTGSPAASCCARTIRSRRTMDRRAAMAASLAMVWSSTANPPSAAASSSITARSSR